MTTAELVTKEQALELLKDAAVTQARAAASALDGLVVQSDEEAALVGDNLKAAKNGAKRLLDLEAQLLAPFKQRVAELKSALTPIHMEMARGISGGSEALLTWDRTKKRRAAEQAESARIAQEAATKAAEEEAAITGEPAPPPMDVVAAPPPSIVRGGASTTFVQRRVAVALEDPKRCDPSWLTLTPAAREAAIAAEKRGELVIPDEGEVVWRGLRCFKNATVASR